MARPKIKPDEVADYFSPTGPKRRASPYDTKYARHTYRVREGTHERLKDIAAENGIGLNDLVRWVFDRFLDGHDSGDIKLPIEEYVVTRSRLSA